MHRLQELVRLHRLGSGPREVAALLGMSPNTERQYRRILGAAGALEGDARDLPEQAFLQGLVEAQLGRALPPQQRSSIEDWLGEVTRRVKQGAEAKAIYDFLRQRHKKDFKGSYWAVKRMVRRIKKSLGVRPEDVAIPVETRAGLEAQVDFGYVGVLFDPETGRRRRAWIWVLVLSHSRHMVVRLVFDQKAATWIRCHVEAFEELGGVVETVVPDNLKAAVIRAAFAVDGQTALNRTYRELARHYNFKIDPTPPYSPEKKGKTESGVKYVKRSFFKPRDLEEEETPRLRSELQEWVYETAGVRTHGTTQRQPLEVFRLEEQGTLQPLPPTRHEVVVWSKAKVLRDSHVRVGKALYSVPFQHLGETLWVRGTSTSVVVYRDHERVATHARVPAGKRATVESHLPEYRVDYRHRDPAYWEVRADSIGPVTGRYVRTLLGLDEALSTLRLAQGVVLHLETVEPGRAEAACRRAEHFGSTTLGAIKEILAKGLEQLPLEEPGLEGTLAAGALLQPRFARDPEELARGASSVAATA